MKRVVTLSLAGALFALASAGVGAAPMGMEKREKLCRAVVAEVKKTSGQIAINMAPQVWGAYGLLMANHLKAFELANCGQLDGMQDALLEAYK